MSRFGYVGAEPTNDNTTNTGAFSVSDLNNLHESGDLKSSSFTCDFLVVGGGGAGGNASPGGGGGAGGVVTSVGNNGGGSSLETALTLSPNVDYNVAVGAGASGYTTIGGGSVFHNIRVIGGGTGWRSNIACGGASGGGGGYAFNYTNTGEGVIRSTGNRSETFGGAGLQGYDGNRTSYESYNSLGGGGGAGASNTVTDQGAIGVISNIAAHGTADVGEVSGSNVYFGAGGGASHNNSATSGGTGGGGDGGVNTVNSGTANTGGGGGGRWNGTPGSGGSGAIVLLYPDHLTCTAGAGVTASAENAESSSKKSIAITAGTGTVSFS